MFDISSLIKLINTSNDKIIQKAEVETYMKQNKSPSIFTEYFSTFKDDLDINTFNNDLVTLSKDASFIFPEYALSANFLYPSIIL